MNKEDILNTARTELKQVYEQYISRGLVSVYLWGSITTPDFDTQKSDIDSLGIVDSSANVEDQSLINTELEKGSLGKWPLKINYISLDELNGGEIKTGLAKVIDPRLLLLDFPFWKHVAGVNYNREDFQSEEITPHDAAQIVLDTIQKRYLPFSDDLKDYKYFLKAFARLVYYLQQGDALKEPFSYSNFKSNVTDEMREAIDKLLEIKSNDWDIDLFKKSLPMFLSIIRKNDKR